MHGEGSRGARCRQAAGPQGCGVASLASGCLLGEATRLFSEYTEKMCRECPQWALMVLSFVRQGLILGAQVSTVGKVRPLGHVRGHTLEETVPKVRGRRAWGRDQEVCSGWPEPGGSVSPNR